MEARPSRKEILGVNERLRPSSGAWPTITHGKQLNTAAGPNEAVLQVDGSGTIVWASQVAQATLASRGGTLVGRTLSEFMGDPEARTLLGPPGSSAPVVRFSRSDGSEVWMSVATSLVLSESQGRRLLRLHDVSELVAARDEATAARAATQRANEQLAGTLDALWDPYLALDPIHGNRGEVVGLRVAAANQAALRALGASEADLLGRELGDWFELAEVAALASFQATVSSGQPMAIDDWPLAGSGATRWFDLRATCVNDRICLSWREVTARHREAVRGADAAARFQELAEFSPDLLMRVDDEGLIGYVSPSSLEILGIDPQELVGTPAMDLIHPDDHEAVREARVEGRLTGELRAFRVRTRQRDGNWLWLEYSSRFVTAEDGTRFRVHRGRDVSEEVAAVAALGDAQQRYQLVAENAGDFLGATDPKGTITWISPAVSHVLGWEPEEMVGRVALEFIDPGSWEQLAGSATAEVADELLRGRAHVRCKDGSLRWIAYQLRPAAVPGSPMGWVASCWDVEAQVAGEQAQAAERARTAAVLESLTDPVLLVEPDPGAGSDGRPTTWRIERANEAARRWLDPESPTILGATITAVFGELAATQVADWCGQVAASRLPLRLDGVSFGPLTMTGPRQYDIRAVRLDGGVSITWRDVTERNRTTRALAESESRYRMLAENAADVVVEADNEGTIRWTSPSISRVLGWSAGQLLGAQGRDLVHPEDQQRAATIQAELRAGNRTTYEARIRTAEGGYRWMQMSAQPVLDADGAVVGRVSGLHDIQAEHEARSALARSEAQFRLMVENATDIVTHIVEGVTEWISPSVTVVLGWSAQELQGQDLSDRFHPDDADAIGRLKIDIAAGRAGRERARFPSKSGDWVSLDIAAQPYLEPDGRWGAVAVLRDVTDLVTAMTALAESEERFRLLAENANDLVMRADPNGVLQWVSPSVANLGWTPEQMIGHVVADFLHPDDVPHTREVARAIEAGDSPIVEARFRDGNSPAQRPAYHWVRARIRPIQDPEGTLVGRIAGWSIIDAERAAAEALADSEARFRAVVETVGSGITVHAADGSITDCNPAAERILGISRDDMMGQHAVRPPWDLIHRDGRRYQPAEHPVVRALATGLPQNGVVMGLDRGDDRTTWLSVNTHVIRLHGGTGQPAVVSSMTDITDLQQAQLDLSDSENRYRLLAENAADIVFRVSPQRTLDWISPAVSEVLGWSPEELVGRPPGEFVHPEDAEAARLALQASPGVETSQVECRARARDGSYRWLWVRIRSLRDEQGELTERVGSARDITEAHEAREELRFLADHDPITRLANRRLAVSALERLLGHPARSGTRTGVLFADMDHLKATNDTYGHAAGDAAIAAIANRLHATVRESDLAARIGGDEFLVVLPGVNTCADAQAMRHKIDAAMAAPLEWNGQQIRLSMSIGVTIAEAGEDAEAVIARADAAAYEAKRRRRAGAEPPNHCG